MNHTDAPITTVRTAVVVGGGVVGVSAAYALQIAGVETTLLTAHAIADGATSANGGLIVPADSVVWPSPANARAIPLTVLGRGGPDITLRWRAPGLLRWGLGFLRNSAASRHRRLSRDTHALSRHSLAVLQRWTVDEGLQFDLDENGMAFLTNDRGSAHAAMRERQALSDAGEEYHLIEDPASIDAAFATQQGKFWAVRTPGAAHGDARLFTGQLADRVRARGGTIREQRPVTSLLFRGGRLVGVQTADGIVEANIVVLAAGCSSRELAAGVGLRLPVLPVKGYTATIAITDSNRVSQVGGVLIDQHIAFSRTDTHLRLSCGAEIGACDFAVPDAVRRRLTTTAEALFPGALDLHSAQFAAGHRPMTPSGLPYVGPAPIPGLFLDTGHGSLGWTQAAGSARLLTDLILGRTPELDPRPYQLRGQSSRSEQEK